MGQDKDIDKAMGKIKKKTNTTTRQSCLMCHMAKNWDSNDQKK